MIALGTSLVSGDPSWDVPMLEQALWRSRNLWDGPCLTLIMETGDDRFTRGTCVIAIVVRQRTRKQH